MIKLGKIVSTKSNRGEFISIVFLYTFSTPLPTNSNYLSLGNSLENNIS